MSSADRWFEHRPVTIGGCDGVVASGTFGEVFLNSLLATADRCWVTLHVAADEVAGHDVFHDLQTWNEESLADFRTSSPDGYDLRLGCVHLRWGALRLEGIHRIDLSHVARCVAAGAC